jgi:protein-tyrosine phosphatase
MWWKCQASVSTAEPVQHRAALASIVRKGSCGLRQESLYLLRSKRNWRGLVCQEPQPEACSVPAALNLLKMTLITSYLALGNSSDPIQFADHVDAVLCCATEVPLYPGKPGHHLRISDGLPIEAKALEEAFQFLDEQIAEAHLVLVYCGHGTSRSVSVLCGYLALKQKAPINEILKIVRQLRPRVKPSPTTFKSVERHVHSLIQARVCQGGMTE